MIFHLIADCEFEADDIDDAMTKLAQHFTTDEEGILPDDHLIIGGYLELAPCTENDS